MSRPGDFLYERAVDLLEHIVVAIGEVPDLPVPEVVYVPGGVPAFATGQMDVDDCCRGHLTARPSTVFLSNVFPNPAVFRGGGCEEGVRAAAFTVQLATCSPTFTHDGSFPSVDALNASGFRAASYMLAMHRGICCAVAEWTGQGWAGTAGAVNEDGEPSGGCQSWTGTAILDLDECACPPITP